MLKTIKFVAVVSLFTITVCVSANASGWQLSESHPVIEYSTEEVKQILDRTIDSMNRADHLPKWTRDRLNWVAGRQINEQFVFNLGVCPNSSAVAISTVDRGGIYRIAFCIGMLTKHLAVVDTFTDQWQQDRYMVNFLSSVVAHEVDHLVHWKFNRSSAEKHEEEIRSHVATILGAIRPLIEAGELVDLSSRLRNQALLNCNDDPSDCSEFRKLVVSH